MCGSDFRMTTINVHMVFEGFLHSELIGCLYLACLILSLIAFLILRKQLAPTVFGAILIPYRPGTDHIEINLSEKPCGMIRSIGCF